MVFNPYYNSNRYSVQNPAVPQYKPYGYYNTYKPAFGDTTPQIPQGQSLDNSNSMQVPGMSFNLNDSAQPNEGGNSWGNTSTGSKVAAGVGIATAGLGAYQGAHDAVDGYSIDNMAGLKGGAQGAAAGSAAGPWGTLIGAVVGTVGGSIGTVKGVSDKLDKVTGQVTGVDYDANGNPVYQGGNVLNAVDTKAAIAAGDKKNYNSSDITGTRWIGEAIFNTRRKARQKQRALEQGINNAQAQYNTAETGNRQNMVAQQDYQNNLNNTNRLYNLYNT